MVAATSPPADRALEEEPEAVAFWLSELGSALDAGSALQRDALVRASGMARIAARTIRLQAERIAALERAVETDPLTGLLNRRGFEKRLTERLAEARRHETAGIILYADIDDLKAINDAHGHAVGDRMLVAFAAALRRAVRVSDVCGRLGGDEFAVVLDRCAPEQGLARASRLGAEIAALTLSVGSEALHLSASIGIAPFEGQEMAEALIELADAQMYEAKRARA